MHRNRRSAIALGALALALFALPDRAAAQQDAYDSYAEVVSVTPRYRWQDVVEPVRRCELVPATATPGHAPGYAPAHRSRGYVVSGGHHEVYPYDAAARRGGVGAGLLGGLIGGLIGNQFGGGSGKAALTVAGAALGASIARNGSHHRYAHAAAVPGRRYVQTDRYVTERCSETRESRLVRQLDGYDVTYRFHGRTFRKWVAEHPGERVPIHVVVEPDPLP